MFVVVTIQRLVLCIVCVCVCHCFDDGVAAAVKNTVIVWAVVGSKQNANSSIQNDKQASPKLAT